MWPLCNETSNCKLNPNKTVKADPTTFQTAEPDIFAGGDAMTGPNFAIDAIALGKEGAVSIHRFVQPGQSLVLGRIKRGGHAAVPPRAGGARPGTARLGRWCRRRARVAGDGVGGGSVTR